MYQPLHNMGTLVAPELSNAYVHVGSAVFACWLSDSLVQRVI